MRSPVRKACLTFRKERGKFRAMASHPHNSPGNADQLVPVPPELIAVVKIGVRAHREVPGSVAVGGTVCALFAHHRVSIDVDFVVSDLKDRFEEIRDHLLRLQGWREARVKVPVLILGSLDGIEVGYRQLRRSVPLETQEILTADGPLIVPSLVEMLRIKAFLAYDRDVTRDFVDFAELACLLDADTVVDALAVLDEKFTWEKQPSVVLEVTKALLRPDPHDYEMRGFEAMRFLKPRLRTWSAVVEKCQDIGRRLSVRLLGGSADAT